MTEVLPTIFEGKSIQVIEQDGEPWFPLADLSGAWGVHRNTLNQIIDRNEKKFAGFHTTIAHVTCAGMKAVNERGLYLLMGAINTDRLKDAQAADAILRFQRWVPELIQQYRKKEIVPVQQQPAAAQELDEVVAYDLIEAKQIAKLTDTDPKPLYAAVLKGHGYEKIAKVYEQQVPAVVHGEAGWYNPTRLVGLCNDPDLTADRLNWYLKNKGFQVKEGGIWRLVGPGFLHGKEYPYNTPSGHSEPRIAWRESVLYASGLKRPMPESQTALPARAGVS
jgi:prophage antirepressor-like protein